MTTNTTNALRALEAEAMWLRSLAASARARMAKLRPDMLDDVAARMEAALATAQPEAKPEGVPVVQQTAPKRIWLAVSDDAHDEHQPFPDSIDGEVTWADDPVVEVCVPYVRADLARQAQGGGEETS